MTDPITTHYIYPPTPDRRWDWTAYRDPERRSGAGPTEAAAVGDLLQQEYEDGEDGGWTDEERAAFLRHRNPTHASHPGECDASCYGYFDA